MNYKQIANRYLDAEIIKKPIYSEEQLKNTIGVNLSELRHLWIFSSQNNFKKAVENLIHNDVKIDFKSANQRR
ncbi:hypothetical protein JCM11957_10660 [Caminibacter profundus]